MFSVILADDETTMRSALTLILQQKLNIQSLCEAANMEELLVKVRAVNSALLLLDWELPGLATGGGLSAIWRICPELKVVALSARPEARQMALSAGVDAFVSKTEPPEAMLKIMTTLVPAPSQT